MFNIKDFLSTLTNHPGVYQMLGEKDKVLYVGKARNLKKRVSSYFSGKQQDIKTQSLIKHVINIEVIITHSENEALLLECNLIKKYKPHYNVLFRDDKSYPYILITHETFPRIDFYRGKKKSNADYFGPYPSAGAARETVHLIQKLFQLRTCHDHFFSTRNRPCLHYQIGQCSGSCTGLISPSDYQKQVHLATLFLQGKNSEVIDELNQHMEKASKHLNFELAARFRDQISRLRQVQEKQYVSSTFKGDADVISLVATAGVTCIQLLSVRDGRMLGSHSYFPSVPEGASSQEIISSFVIQHYLGVSQDRIPKEIITSESLLDRDWLMNALTEKAERKISLSHHVRGERKKWLEMVVLSAKQSLASQLQNKINTKQRMEALQKLLGLKKLPTRIECFDISHSMGEATVASCVVFNVVGPQKSDYRRFNISGITPGNDIAAMEQALTRRYKKLQHDHVHLPDIILIDGGLAQLGIAQKVLASLEITDIILIGVAKGVTRKPGYETLYIPNQSPIHLAPDSLALLLIQQIRDEAHRFAITGHRNRRDKKRKTSTLEEIPGIGAKRRRDLLRYFGGIQAINRASLDEIAKVPGISRELAQRIFESLHDVSV